MKRILSIFFLSTVILTITGCEQFETSYERIDHNEFRMLDFIYEPADIAPGDSVTLTAVFAGKNVGDLDSYLDWWISFSVIRDIFGNTTVVDSGRLDVDTMSRRYYTDFSPNTQAISLRFKIPEDIVRTSPSIPPRWTDMLPLNIVNQLPQELREMTKDEVVDSIESGSEIVNPITLQLFTVPIRISARMQTPGKLPHTIVSNHSVRYNSRFADNPAIPINTNPVIDSVVVYKIRGELAYGSLRDTVGRTFTKITLDNTGEKEIVVESGYSYFLEGITSNIDRIMTMDGRWTDEKHLSYRQFMLHPEEAGRVHHSKYIDINNQSGQITMPTDRRITQFIFWITVTDEAMNERLRPQGSALAEVSGRFVYE